MNNSNNANKLHTNVNDGEFSRLTKLIKLIIISLLRPNVTQKYRGVHNFYVAFSVPNLQLYCVIMVAISDLFTRMADYPIKCFLIVYRSRLIVIVNRASAERETVRLLPERAGRPTSLQSATDAYWRNAYSDMSHDTDCPYPVWIGAFFEKIRPYQILIRIRGKL